MNRPKVLLSVCIPTYNRKNRVRLIVEKILATNYTNIEIVVVDNCSTDSIKEELSSIDDPRFVYLSQSVMQPGIANIVCAINSGSGKYSMLCLDKDNIDIDYLGQFLEFLDAHQDLSWGQCSLNQKEASNYKFHTQGFDTLLTCGYECFHPTGFFVCKEILNKTGIIDHVLRTNNSFPFNPDIVKAQMIMCGAGCRFNLPMMSTETLDEAAQTKSSYPVDNLWFSPKNISLRLIVFMHHTATLGLSLSQYKKMVKKLYNRNLYELTFGFKRILANKFLCAHYGIEVHNVTIFELLKYHYNYIRCFLQSDVSLSKRYRIGVGVFVAVKWGANLLLKR